MVIDDVFGEIEINEHLNIVRVMKKMKTALGLSSVIASTFMFA